ncbi:MAG: HNH endonuclease [Sulfurimonas sp.]|nr:HNH endonuclease [Sulfurimonas sp.]
MSKECKRTPNYKCVICGNDMYIRPSAIKKSKGWGFACSKECGKINRSKHTIGLSNHQYGVKGERNASFKGHRKISTYGYVLIYIPEHPRANHAWYVFEHLLVMENHIGRPLKYYGFKNKNNEVCHHIDRDKQNNSIENLQLMTEVEHLKLHLMEDKERSLKAGRTRSKFNEEDVLLICEEYKKRLCNSIRVIYKI